MAAILTPAAQAIYDQLFKEAHGKFSAQQLDAIAKGKGYESFSQMLESGVVSQLQAKGIAPLQAAAATASETAATPLALPKAPIAAPPAGTFTTAPTVGELPARAESLRPQTVTPSGRLIPTPEPAPAIPATPQELIAQMKGVQPGDYVQGGPLSADLPTSPLALTTRTTAMNPGEIPSATLSGINAGGRPIYDRAAAFPMGEVGTSSLTPPGTTPPLAPIPTPSGAARLNIPSATTGTEDITKTAAETGLKDLASGSESAAAGPMAALAAKLGLGQVSTASGVKSFLPGALKSAGAELGGTKTTGSLALGLLDKAGLGAAASKIGIGDIGLGSAGIGLTAAPFAAKLTGALDTHIPGVSQGGVADQFLRGAAAGGTGLGIATGDPLGALAGAVGGGVVNVLRNLNKGSPDKQFSATAAQGSRQLMQATTGMSDDTRNFLAQQYRNQVLMLSGQPGRNNTLKDSITKLLSGIPQLAQQDFASQQQQKSSQAMQDAIAQYVQPQIDNMLYERNQLASLYEANGSKTYAEAIRGNARSMAAAWMAQAQSQPALNALAAETQRKNQLASLIQSKQLNSIVYPNGGSGSSLTSALLPSTSSTNSALTALGG